VVVEKDEPGVQPGDHQVLVVARIADDGGAIARPREVFEDAARFDLEVGVVGRVVEPWGASRPLAVQGVDVERGRARVRRARWLGRNAQFRVVSKVMS
jgi:hypothetical protein